MAGVFWMVLAVVLTLASFFLELVNGSGGHPRAALAGAIGFAMGPYILASILLFFNKYRNPASFFKAVAILSFLLVMNGMVQVADKKMSRQKSAENTVKSVESVNTKKTGNG
jgi:hypothetical protein